MMRIVFSIRKNSPIARSKWRHPLPLWGVLLAATLVLWFAWQPASASDSRAVPPSETMTVVRMTPTPPIPTPTITPTPTRTPIPAYMLDVAHATDGIISGTLLLVIIVLVGTIAGIAIRRKQHSD